LRTWSGIKEIMPSSAEQIAKGVFDMLISNRLFCVYQVTEDDCLIVWSSATLELLEARIQEGIDEGAIDER